MAEEKINPIPVSLPSRKGRAKSGELLSIEQRRRDKPYDAFGVSDDNLQLTEEQGEFEKKELEDLRPIVTKILAETEDPPIQEQLLRHCRHNLSHSHGQMDNSLTRDHWQVVFEAYKATGNPEVLAQVTQFEVKQINHLIKYGVARLGLPPIHAYAVNQAQVNLQLQKLQKERVQSIQHQETKTAIQHRVAEEAAAAQRLLNSGGDLGTVLDHWLRQTVNAIAAGRFKEPEEITRFDLEALSKALDTYSKIMERAIKLKRLTAGQPTDLLGVQIGLLVDRLPPEELDKLANGQIPASLFGQTAHPVQLQAQQLRNSQQPIDAEFQEMSLSRGMACPDAGEDQSDHGTINDDDGDLALPISDAGRNDNEEDV